MILDRRGHCVECPPCAQSHDGHCPRHFPEPTDGQRLERYGQTLGVRVHVYPGRLGAPVVIAFRYPDGNVESIRSDAKHWYAVGMAYLDQEAERQEETRSVAVESRP